MANNGSSELPREVLAVLPSDPYEQLDVARKITAMAVSSRLSMLESESGKLRQRLQEKDQIVYTLQERVSELEQALQESSAQLSQALDEQVCLPFTSFCLPMCTAKSPNKSSQWAPMLGTPDEEVCLPIWGKTRRWEHYNMKG